MPKIHFVAEALLLVAGDELKIKMKNLDFYFKDALWAFTEV